MKLLLRLPRAALSSRQIRTIYLTVSKGNDGAEVLIPDLRGLSVAEADKKLREIHLSIGSVTYAPSDEYADGKIISQSPSSPEKASKGAKVDVVVSKNAVRRQKMLPVLSVSRWTRLLLPSKMRGILSVRLTVST